MEDTDLRLNGNAAAGVLAEVFSFDVTNAWAVCDGCGSARRLGSLDAYGLTMGAVLRCSVCDGAMIRISRIANGQHWLDLRGMRVLRVQAAE